MHGAVHAQPTDAQRQALDQLDAQLDGWILYTQEDKAAEQGGWTVRKMKISDWRPIDLAPGRFARWSPDGRHIAVWVADRTRNAHYAVGTVYVMDANGRNRRPLMNDVVAWQFRTGIPIEFHADGRHVIVSKGREEGQYGKGDHLYLVDIRTGRAERLDLGLDVDQGQTYNTEPQIDAKGRYLAMRISGVEEIGGGGNGPLGLFDLREKKLLRVFGHGCMAGLSPDGQWLMNNFRGHNRITFHHRTDDGREVFVSAGEKIGESAWDAAHWSNHPDWFAIRGEGKAWPVYIASFSENSDEMAFTRVVFDGGKCEYPDLYVERTK